MARYALFHINRKYVLAPIMAEMRRQAPIKGLGCGKSPHGLRALTFARDGRKREPGRMVAARVRCAAPASSP